MLADGGASAGCVVPNVDLVANALEVPVVVGGGAVEGDALGGGGDAGDRGNFGGAQDAVEDHDVVQRAVEPHGIGERVLRDDGEVLVDAGDDAEAVEEAGHLPGGAGRPADLDAIDVEDEQAGRGVAGHADVVPLT